MLTLKAARDLEMLPERSRALVRGAIKQLAAPGSVELKKLEGRDGYRMNAGDHRILFDEDKVTVLAIYRVRQAAAARHKEL